MKGRPRLDAKDVAGIVTAILGAVGSFLVAPNALPFTILMVVAGAIYLVWASMERRNHRCEEELRGYKWALLRTIFAVNNTPRGKKVNLDVNKLFAPPGVEEEERLRSMMP